MGAEVQFEITDVETMVREVVDHQDILRSLGRTLITKTLTKKTVQGLTKDKVCASLVCSLTSGVLCCRGWRRRRSRTT